jgi:hypothetical protein
MHKALLSEQLTDSGVRCNICQWRCSIAPERTGVCRMYKNVEGMLYNMNYALASSVAIDPIEKNLSIIFIRVVRSIHSAVGAVISTARAARTGRFPARILLRLARVLRKFNLTRPFVWPNMPVARGSPGPITNLPCGLNIPWIRPSWLNPGIFIPFTSLMAI